MSDLFGAYSELSPYTKYLLVHGAKKIAKEIKDIFSEDDNDESSGHSDVHIAVLGASCSGKTRVTEFLVTGSLSDKDYRRTTERKELSVRFIQLIRMIGIRLEIDTDNDPIKETMCVLHDVPGANADQEWKESFSRAVLCLYLIRTDKLLSRDIETELQIIRDMEMFASWASEMDEEERPDVVFVGTHCNPTYSDSGTLVEGHTRQDYGRRVEELPILQEISDSYGSENATLVLGSMRSRREAKTLLSRVFEVWLNS